jgi:hypothetical protein
MTPQPFADFGDKLFYMSATGMIYSTKQAIYPGGRLSAASISGSPHEDFIKEGKQP